MAQYSDCERNSAVAELINIKNRSNEFFISLELTTNTTKLEMKHQQILRDALFVSVVWSGKLAKFKMEEKEMDLSELFSLLEKLKYMNIHILPHLTCFEMNKQKLKYILERFSTFGVQDVLALRGDGDYFIEYSNALELINAIHFYAPIHNFNIAVAGYPQGHPESSSFEQDFNVLLKKIDAGAKFVITQFFFNVGYFINFVEKCHQEYGIHIPIIPAILLAPSFNFLEKISTLAKVTLPTSLRETRDMSNNSFVEYYTKFVVQQILTILRHSYATCTVCGFKQINGVHLCSMNDLKMTSEVYDLIKDGLKSNK